MKLLNLSCQSMIFVDIGVDDSGIYEMVIELAVIFEKKGNKDEE
ncbi:MAG: hypothetical protein ACLVBP_16230 [Ruminococcus sp.]